MAYKSPDLEDDQNRVRRADVDRYMTHNVERQRDPYNPETVNKELQQQIDLNQGLILKNVQPDEVESEVFERRMDAEMRSFAEGRLKAEQEKTGIVTNAGRALKRTGQMTYFRHKWNQVPLALSRTERAKRKAGILIKTYTHDIVMEKQKNLRDYTENLFPGATVHQKKQNLLGNVTGINFPGIQDDLHVGLNLAVINQIHEFTKIGSPVTTGATAEKIKIDWYRDSLEQVLFKLKTAHSTVAGATPERSVYDELYQFHRASLDKFVDYKERMDFFIKAERAQRNAMVERKIYETPRLKAFIENIGHSDAKAKVLARLGADGFSNIEEDADTKILIAVMEEVNADMINNQGKTEADYNIFIDEAFGKTTGIEILDDGIKRLPDFINDLDTQSAKLLEVRRNIENYMKNPAPPGLPGVIPKLETDHAAATGDKERSAFAGQLADARKKVAEWETQRDEAQDKINKCMREILAIIAATGGSTGIPTITVGMPPMEIVDFTDLDKVKSISNLQTLKQHIDGLHAHPLEAADNATSIANIRIFRNELDKIQTQTRSYRQLLEGKKKEQEAKTGETENAPTARNAKQLAFMLLKKHYSQKYGSEWDEKQLDARVLMELNLRKTDIEDPTERHINSKIAEIADKEQGRWWWDQIGHRLAWRWKHRNEEKIGAQEVINAVNKLDVFKKKLKDLKPNSTVNDIRKLGLETKEYPVLVDAFRMIMRGFITTEKGLFGRKKQVNRVLKPEHAMTLGKMIENFQYLYAEGAQNETLELTEKMIAEQGLSRAQAVLFAMKKFDADTREGQSELRKILGEGKKGIFEKFANIFNKKEMLDKGRELKQMQKEGKSEDELANAAGPYDYKELISLVPTILGGKEMFDLLRSGKNWVTDSPNKYRRSRDWTKNKYIKTLNVGKAVGGRIGSLTRGAFNVATVPFWAPYRGAGFVNRKLGITGKIGRAKDFSVSGTKKVASFLTAPIRWPLKKSWGLFQPA